MRRTTDDTHGVRLPTLNVAQAVVRSLALLYPSKESRGAAAQRRPTNGRPPERRAPPPLFTQRNSLFLRLSGSRPLGRGHRGDRVVREARDADRPRGHDPPRRARRAPARPRRQPFEAATLNWSAPDGQRFTCSTTLPASAPSRCTHGRRPTSSVVKAAHADAGVRADARVERHREAALRVALERTLHTLIVSRPHRTVTGVNAAAFRQGPGAPGPEFVAGGPRAGLAGGRPVPHLERRTEDP